MIPAFVVLLVLSTQDATALIESGREKHHQKDYRGALADLAKAIELDPKRGIAYEYRAETRTALDDLKGAIADYTDAIKINPKAWGAWFGRGVNRLNTRDLDGGIADLTRAIELDPKHPLPYWNRGMARVRKDDAKGALEDFNKAIELHPKYTEAYSSRARLRQDTDPDAALADFSKAIELGSRNSSDFLFRGNIYLYRKKSPDQALVDFERAVKLAPESPFVYFFRGAAHTEREEWDQATADFTRAIEIDAKATTSFIGRATAKQRRGDRVGALSDLSLAVESDQDALSYWYRGCLHFDLGQWKKAWLDFQKVRELKAEYVDSAVFRTWICRARLGEREAATKELKDHLASRKAPAEGDWEGRVGKYLAGSLSEKDLLAAATDDGKRTSAWFYIGTMKSLGGDRGGADAAFQKCVDLRQKNSLDFSSAVVELEASKKGK